MSYASSGRRADSIAADELRDMCLLALQDLEPPAAAAVLLRYKLSNELTEGQITNFSIESQDERLWEQSADLERRRHREIITPRAGYQLWILAGRHSRNRRLRVGCSACRRLMRFQLVPSSDAGQARPADLAADVAASRQIADYFPRSRQFSP